MSPCQSTSAVHTRPSNGGAKCFECNGDGTLFDPKTYAVSFCEACGHTGLEPSSSSGAAGAPETEK